MIFKKNIFRLSVTFNNLGFVSIFLLFISISFTASDIKQVLGRGWGVFFMWSKGKKSFYMQLL